MSMFRFVIFILLYIFSISVNSAQKIDKYLLLEDSVRCYLDTLKKAENNQKKIVINENIYRILKSCLIQKESFSYKFDSLQTKIGILNSPDNNFRFYTWYYVLSDGTYKYFGFIQVKEKEDSVKLFELIDRAEEIDNPENLVLSAGKWYGSLYYKILKNKVDNRIYYTMLALRFNNLFTTSKIIEIFYFDEFGNPVFGAPVLSMGNKDKHRVVFEYSARVAMNLKYDEKMDMIIFDHLAPSENKYTGYYEYYGPDFTFDGFVFKNKKWIYKTNLDIRNPETTTSPKPRTSNKLR